MNPNRLRAGALVWLLTLQFFVVEAIAQARYDGPYARTGDVISALGAADSPAAPLMNASFVVQAGLILGGVLLLRPALLGAAGRIAPVLLGAAALGVLLVGVFPQDTSAAVHGTGAVLYLVGGALGLIALAYSLRPRSEAAGTTLALLGVLGASATAFFLTGVVGYLGEGGTERAAAYVLPLGLAVAGVALWRLGDRPVPTTEERPSRRQLREQERDRRVSRAREQEAALRAGAGPAAGHTPTGDDPAPSGGAEPRSDDDGGADPDELEDPWAAPSRRRLD